MTVQKEIYLLGMSGHALSVIEAMQSNNQFPIGYFDSKENQASNMRFLGKESKESIELLVGNDACLFPAVGSNELRKKMIDIIIECGYNQVNIFHNKSIISQTAVIGNSSFIAAGSIVNAMAKIGVGVIINSGAIIEHECIIADYVHIAPGAVLAGAVTVGDLTFIGANATVKQGVKIGSNVIIGAGSVVLNDVPNNSVYVGNPAKYLKANV